ncbi:mannitol-1-phosphate dehydrogenase [Moniliophthora roreri MCA 2997]|uniref:alcohol dehydrogenase n=2 Tax=Moniliophthora roreri TaxID=221103 RepID=V2X8F2_MONRO|nr:mannitol-1-phosphate dehydrogenase [Moniliophthora roreri MCA 2997]
MTTNIPKTAKAAVIREFNKPLDIQDWPVKQPSELAPGECLIKLAFAGCCHSDLHVKENEWGFPAKLPLVGGHEGIGHIVAIGEHTINSPVKIGDRVGLKWIASSCLRCEMCKKGKEACCLYQRSHGFTDHGTFAEYVTSWTDYVTPIPENLESAAATPILCAGITVYNALKQCNARMGEWVAISGAGGGLGHLAVQYAIAMGLRVVAIDTGSSKKELCQRIGAEKWVDFMESKDVIRDVQDATGGLGPHAAIVTAGSAVPFNQALMYLRLDGTLVCVGMPSGEGMLNVPIRLIVPKGLKIVGTSTGNRQDMAEALATAASGKVKCHYELKSLNQINDVMDAMQQGKIAGRIVLQI